MERELDELMMRELTVDEIIYEMNEFRLDDITVGDCIPMLGTWDELSVLDIWFKILPVNMREEITPLSIINLFQKGSNDQERIVT